MVIFHIKSTRNPRVFGEITRVKSAGPGQLGRWWSTCTILRTARKGCFQASDSVSSYIWSYIYTYTVYIVLYTCVYIYIYLLYIYMIIYMIMYDHVWWYIICTNFVVTICTYESALRCLFLEVLHRGRRLGQFFTPSELLGVWWGIYPQIWSF